MSVKEIDLEWLEENTSEEMVEDVKRTIDFCEKYDDEILKAKIVEKVRLESGSHDIELFIITEDRYIFHSYDVAKKFYFKRTIARYVVNEMAKMLEN